MIELVTYDGHTMFVAPSAIASVTEAGTSSQWHGIRSIVRLFDGKAIEASQTAQWVVEQIRRAAAPAGGEPT